MSPLFLIAALLTADPEKIESIEFVATPAYAAKVRTFKFDYSAALLQKFLRSDRLMHYLHFAIVNDYYVFEHKEKEMDRYSGIGVHGMTGEVREVVFVAEGPVFDQARQQLPDCQPPYMAGENLIEEEFSDPHPVLRVDYRETQRIRDDIAGQMRKAPLENLKAEILRRPGLSCSLALDALIDRGADGVPVALELLRSDDRLSRLYGLDFFARVETDIRTVDTAILQVIRKTAAEDFPICISRLERVVVRRIDVFGPQLLAIIQDEHVPSRERAFALLLLGATKDKQYLPVAESYAISKDSEPQLARTAVFALRFMEKERVIDALRGANKTARITACYCIGLDWDLHRKGEGLQRQMSNEADIETRDSALAALREINNYR